MADKPEITPPPRRERAGWTPNPGDKRQSHSQLKKPEYNLLEQVGQERERTSSICSSLAHLFCGMDLQKVLSRMVLFLLFLYLTPLGSRSHPLGSPSQSPEQVKMQVSSEGLHRQVGSAQRVWAAATERPPVLWELDL